MRFALGLRKAFAVKSTSKVARPSSAPVEKLESRQLLSAAVAGWPAHGIKFTAFEQAAYHGKVATFKGDLATFGLPLGVSINWGDGQTSGGSIAPNLAGGYDVVGAHTYNADKDYDVEVIVTASPPKIPGQPTPFHIIRLFDVHSTADVEELQPVTLHLSNPIPDLSADLSVTPNGLLTFSAPTIKTRPVQLTDAQQDLVRNAFAGFDKLKDNYPNPAGSNAGALTLSYGAKTVHAGLAANNIPPVFQKIEDLLKSYAGLGV